MATRSSRWILCKVCGSAAYIHTSKRDNLDYVTCQNVACKVSGEPLTDYQKRPTEG